MSTEIKIIKDEYKPSEIKQGSLLIKDGEIGMAISVCKLLVTVVIFTGPDKFTIRNWINDSYEEFFGVIELSNLRK